MLFGQDCDFGPEVGTLEPWTKPSGTASKEETLPFGEEEMSNKGFMAL